jgi:hypothetical protein
MNDREKEQSDFLDSVFAINRNFQTGPLQCAWCDRKFEDFGPLAEHVRTECGPNNQGERENNMLPLPKQTQTAATGKGGRPEFLKLAHLSGSPQKVTVEKLILEKTQYSDCTMLVTIDKVKYLAGLKFNTSNYENLVTAFGQDETKWPGKQFIAAPELSEIWGTEIMAFSVPRDLNKKEKV